MHYNGMLQVTFVKFIYPSEVTLYIRQLVSIHLMSAEGQITRLPESACNIVNISSNIYLQNVRRVV